MCYHINILFLTAEFTFYCSLIALHLTRLSEDFIIFASKEFGYINIAESFSTGSSLMPQKRNPDSLELVRGTSGTIFGQVNNGNIQLSHLS